MRSLVSIWSLSNSRAPGGPVTFWWQMWGQRLPKLPKPKCVKNVQSSKCSKQHFQGLANKVPVKECARVFCVCQSVLPASPGLFSPRGLVQPCPAFPSLLQLTPPRPGPRSLAQRPRESAYCSGSFPEKLQGPGALTVPRDVPRRSTWPYSPPAHRNCAQD